MRGRWLHRGQLVADLLRQGHRRIRAVDLKPLDEWYQCFHDAENLQLNLQERSGVRLKHRYNVSAPKGVNGRNSDNTMIVERLGWAPNVSLRVGLEKTYRWIFDQMAADSRRPQTETQTQTTVV